MLNGMEIKSILIIKVEKAQLVEVLLLSKINKEDRITFLTILSLVDKIKQLSDWKDFNISVIAYFKDGNIQIGLSCPDFSKSNYHIFEDIPFAYECVTANEECFFDCHYDDKLITMTLKKHQWQTLKLNRPDIYEQVMSRSIREEKEQNE